MYNDSCASAISVSQGMFATYHFSLLEATYRVKQQDKLIEWDTMTPKTQSNQRRANNCKGIVKETISPVYWRIFTPRILNKQPNTQRRCVSEIFFRYDPKKSKHCDWDASF